LVPLVGEPLPLDFVNTRPQPERGIADQFGTVDGVGQWLLLESDRLPAARVTEGVRNALVSLRLQVRLALEAIVAGARPPSSALECLNLALQNAPTHSQLRWDASGPHVDSIRIGDEGAQLLATLAEATVEYLASDLAAKTRQCEAPDCELLFSLTHPRRRWCSPTVCGNRTRVARYYERHKN
jgi:predicted RNA-binding Zn ribbon-like protein